MDAVHYAPHQLVDVQAIGCDFLACSAYKFYGPHIGILWGRRALIEATDVPRLAPAPQESPERLETGTQNHEAIVGAAAAVDFLAGLAPRGTPGGRRGALAAAYGELHRRGMALLEQLWTGLEATPGVTLFGPRPGQPRTPTLSFIKQGEETTAIARRLATAGLFVSNGDYYATTVMERLGQIAGRNGQNRDELLFERGGSGADEHRDRAELSNYAGPVLRRADTTQGRNHAGPIRRNGDTTPGRYDAVPIQRRAETTQGRCHAGPKPRGRGRGLRP